MEQIKAILTECLAFDPNKGITGIDDAARRIEGLMAEKPAVPTLFREPTWECIDDETPDFGLNKNWREEDKISKGMVLLQDGEIEWGQVIRFDGHLYNHDISKFKRLS